MTIKSTIAELGLFDLFQIIYMNGKTGRLIISEGPDDKQAQMIFKDGDLCFAVRYRNVPKSIESLLVDWGLIDGTAVVKIEKAREKYENFLDCLDGEGIGSREQLESFFAGIARENVYEVLKWEKGNYRFIEEGVDEKHEILVPMNTENMIMEGARRIDEWSNIKSKVPSRHSVFRICSDQQQCMNLKPREWEILSLIDGVRTVSEINELVKENLFSTSKLIYGLVVMGVIELVEDDIHIGGKDEESIDHYLEKGKECYQNLNLEGAAGAYEKALRMDRESFRALRMLGEIYYKMGRLNEALVYLEKARSARPENQKAMFIKGYLHARLGEIKKAIYEWEELREKTSNPRIAKMVKRRIEVAGEWDKILQEY